MSEKNLLPIRLGIDVGSTTVKVAVLDDDDKLIYGDCYKGKNVDEGPNLNTGSSDLAKKINLMETRSEEHTSELQSLY